MTDNDITENNDVTESTDETAESTDETAESTDDEVTETAEADAQNAPVETPKRTVRKPRKVVKVAENKVEAPARKRPEKIEPGDKVKSSELPDDIVQAGRFPKFISNTTRVTNRLADLREDPIERGSEVNPKLLWQGDTYAQFEKMVKTLDGPYWVNSERIVFLGSDKFGNLDWLVGTKGEKVSRVRESKSGKLTLSHMTLSDVEKTYYLGVMFDKVEFDYWNLDTPDDWQQYNLGVKAARLAEEKRKAAAAKKAAEVKKRAEEDSKPKPKTVRVRRPKAKVAAASK